MMMIDELSGRLWAILGRLVQTNGVVRAGNLDYCFFCEAGHADGGDEGQWKHRQDCPLLQARTLLDTLVSQGVPGPVCPSFFGNDYTWFGCSRCNRFYALTVDQWLVYPAVPLCPEGHPLGNRVLSKQWQELTALWALYTALYLDQAGKIPSVPQEALEQVDRIQLLLFPLFYSEKP